MKKLIEILSHKEIINPKDSNTQYIGNYKCHVNCLSYYLKNKSNVKSIIGGLQVFDDNDTAAHFIIDLKDGKFIDPTYGNVTTKLYSYFIPIEAYVPSSFNPNRELINLKQYFYNLLPWWIRLFKNKDDI